MCCKVSEKPKGAPKGVMLSAKRSVINCIWYDLTGYFGDLGTPPNFFHVS